MIEFNFVLQCNSVLIGRRRRRWMLEFLNCGNFLFETRWEVVTLLNTPHEGLASFAVRSGGGGRYHCSSSSCRNPFEFLPVPSDAVERANIGHKLKRRGCISCWDGLLKNPLLVESWTWWIWGGESDLRFNQSRLCQVLHLHKKHAVKF